MKIKLAAMALLTSVAMFCSDCNADLLGRMLGRGGCGGCQAAPTCCDTPAPSCGGRGISININIGMPGRLFRGNGCGGGCGLLSGGGGCGLLSGGGCGGGIVDGGCGGGCDGGCGGEVLSGGCGGGGGGRIRGLFSRLLSCDGGCGAPAGDCGCAPAPAPAPCGPTCGSDNSCGGGLLTRGGGLFSRLGGIGGGCGCNDGCGSPAPAPCAVAAPAPCVAAPAPCAAPASSCGCIDAPACGCGGNMGGRVKGLLNRVGSIGCGTCGSKTTCGCGSRAPVRSMVSRIPRPSFGGGGCGCNDAPSCGCAAPAPAPSCGCGDGCSAGNGCLKNVLSRIPRPFKNCRCGKASCGGGCKLGLLDRLRGDRTPRGAGCPTNDGCNSPCPNSGCSSCDSGFAAAAPCNSCGGGTVNYDAGSYQTPTMSTAPMEGVYESVPQGQLLQPIQSAPATNVPAATEGSVIVPSTDGAQRGRSPLVDPSAFVISTK